MKDKSFEMSESDAQLLMNNLLNNIDNNTPQNKLSALRYLILGISDRELKWEMICLLNGAVINEKKIYE